MHDFSGVLEDFQTGFKSFCENQPKTGGAFQSLMGAAESEGELPLKMKELISLAISIAVRCEGCIAHHSKAVLEAGATRGEVTEMICVAILMGGGPSAVYGAEALQAYDSWAAKQN